MAMAITVAIAFWGGMPNNCNTIKAVKVDFPPPKVGSAPLGRGCRFKYASRIRRQRTMCWVAKHETGHLFGKRHNPASPVMRATLTLPPGPFCRNP